MSGRAYIGGSRPMLADLILYCGVDFISSVGQSLDARLQTLGAWFKRMDARPSAASTLSPNWKEIGMRG